jgi:hypothetical protein
LRRRAASILIFGSADRAQGEVILIMLFGHIPDALCRLEIVGAIVELEGHLLGAYLADHLPIVVGVALAKVSLGLLLGFGV